MEINARRVSPARVPKLALSIAEAADALALSARTVEELVKLGQLPIVRIGRRVLLPVAALKSWLDGQTEAADDAPTDAT
jgi:excisionase family DNA binding protein